MILGRPGMEMKVLLLAILAAFDFRTSTPLAMQPTDDFLPEVLHAYVSWSREVSWEFLNTAVSSDQVHRHVDVGSFTYDALMTAIRQKKDQLGADFDTEETEQNVLTTLEGGLMKSVSTDKLVGLLMGTSQFENHGARLAIASKLFRRITVQLSAIVDQLETNEIDAEKLNEIVEKVLASRMTFDAMIANFESVEKTVGPVVRAVVENELETEDGEEVVEGARLSRGKRQAGGINFGGGFSVSTEGGLTFNLGQVRVAIGGGINFESALRVGVQF